MQQRHDFNLMRWACAGALVLAMSQTQAEASGLLAQIETEVQQLAAELSQSVVTIRAVRRTQNRSELREVYVGTGVVFDSGWVVTTPSVVGSNVSYSIQAFGQIPVPAELIGYHSDGQTAVFRAPNLRATPARMQSRGTLIPGQILTVLGNSFGLDGAVTWGIAAGERDDGLWQIGVKVAPGGSGSPVINSSGEVVGMVVAALMASDRPAEAAYGSGSALMVPMSHCMPVALRMKREGTVGRAFLGIQPGTVAEEITQSLGGTRGVLVAAVSMGSPAYGAGLQAGDIIVEMDRRAMLHERLLRQVLAEHCPGETVDLVLVRDRKMSKVSVVLGMMPEMLPLNPAVQPTSTYMAASLNVVSAATPGEIQAEILYIEKRLEELKRRLEAP